MTRAAGEARLRHPKRNRAKPAGERDRSSVRADWGRRRTRRTLVKTKAPVPILMYHVIDAAAGDASCRSYSSIRRHSTTQMEMLKPRGYTGVSLNQVYDAWFKGGELPEKPVVVSFDDGYPRPVRLRPAGAPQARLARRAQPDRRAGSTSRTASSARRWSSR